MLSYSCPNRRSHGGRVQLTQAWVKRAYYRKLRFFGVYYLPDLYSVSTRFFSSAFISIDICSIFFWI